MSEPHPAPSAANSEAEIRKHFRTFSRLVDKAERALERSQLLEAAVHVQSAGFYAAYEHCGLFSSPRCERILHRVSQQVGRQWLAPASGATPPRRVLHVLTQAHGLGGHTRLAWRWIARDQSRVHSVALTQQQGLDVPVELAHAVHASGGTIFQLDGAWRSLLDRAGDLWDLACKVDVVVLHVHPYDVLPSLAFGARSIERPVVLLNHADHIFWLGGTCADLVVNLRRSGQALAIARRHIDVERCAILPIPVHLEQRILSREEAKQRIRVPREAVLLLSVAAAHKYGRTPHTQFLDLVLSVIEGVPSARLIVIGPQEDAGWNRARERTDGRIRVVGTRKDVATFYQAADIYVDSYPWGSLTSLIEAASYGTPVLSLATPGVEPAVLSSDLPGVPNDRFQAPSFDEYHSRLARLATDPGYRTEVGCDLAARVTSTHAGHEWMVALDQVYGRAMPGPRKPLYALDRPLFSAVDVMLEQSAPRLVGLPAAAVAVQQSMRLLPMPARCAAWFDLATRHRIVDPRFLLSDTALGAAKRALGR